MILDILTYSTAAVVLAIFIAVVRLAFSAKKST